MKESEMWMYDRSGPAKYFYSKFTKLKSRENKW